MSIAVAEGWEGWDEYPPSTTGRTHGRSGGVTFPSGGTWRSGLPRPVLELGCGTGRIAVPLGRAGVPVVGIDRSTPMLARARQRVQRGRLQRNVRLVRGDIRVLPFPAASPFGLVMAPYGMLQSLLRERDLTATLQAVARVLRPGALFGIDLVADLPNWSEYRRELRLSGWRPGRRSHITLVESVRQDRKRGLTIFEQEYIERRGRDAASKRFDWRSVPCRCHRCCGASNAQDSVCRPCSGTTTAPRGIRGRMCG